LTGFCGKCLLETVRQEKAFVSYEDWIRYASQLLIRELPGWPTMQKLVETLKKPIAQSSRMLLLTHFLPSNSSITVNEQETPLARYLTAEGALVNKKEPQTYEIPSPLIRNLLLRHLIQEFPLQNVPKEPIPFRNEGTELDVVEILKISLKYFNRETLSMSSRYAYKRARTAGIKRDMFVPQEGVYQVQLYSVLEKWIQLPLQQLSTHISIWSLANVPTLIGSKEKSLSSKRSDLVLDLNGSKYLLELLATSSNADISEHIKRTKEYAKALDAQESWVVHFVATMQFDTNKLVWPEKEDQNDVNMMYIFHDLNWKEAMLVTRATTMETQQTKIKLE
jgi:hypothetical protein